MRVLFAFVALVLSTGIHELHSQQVDADVQPAHAAPWAMYGHDSQHSGRSPRVGPQAPDVAWRRPTAFSTYGVAAPSVPAIAAGTIYVAVLGDKLLAVRRDGTIKWAYQAGGIISHLSPAIGPDGTVYIGSTNGILYAINPDGTSRWTFQTLGELGIPAVGLDGTIYVGSEDGGLYAVRPDGTLRWRFSGCPGTFETGCFGIGDEPAALGLDGTVYFHNSGSCIDEPQICWPSVFVALNADGTARWRVSTGASGGFAPSVDRGTIYFASSTDRLIAFRPDGRVKWTYDAPAITAGTSIAGDGTIYVPTVDGLHAVNPLGIRRWFASTAHALRDRPAVGGDGAVYVNGDYEDIYAFEPDGTLKWRFQPPGINPAGVAIGPDGRLYFGTGASRFSFSYLYAIGTATAGDGPD